MFGLFKPKLAPEGPVEFQAEVDIAKSANEVYAMIDWSDERNAKRATGNQVDAVEGQPGHFVMIMPMLPDLRFEMEVTKAARPKKYSFNSRIEPQCGNLAHSHEAYEIAEVGESSCHLTLSLTATFAPGLLLHDYHEEVAMMAASLQSAVQKLKLQAEHGAEVAKAIEQNTLL